MNDREVLMRTEILVSNGFPSFIGPIRPQILKRHRKRRGRKWRDY